MKKILIALFTIVLLLITYVVYSIIDYNSDESKIKRIDKYLESKYNATFEYVMKVYPSNDIPYYQFKMNENTSILIKTRSFLYDQSGMSVVPFYIAPDEWGYIEENFPQELRDFIVKRECNDEINLKQMGMTRAVQKIYDTLSEVTRQMNYYIKENSTRNNYVRLRITYGNYDPYIGFSELDKKAIENILYEFLAESGIEY